MTIVINVYIIICIALLLFDVGFLILKNKRTDVFFPKNEKLKNKIKEEIEYHYKKRKFSDGFEDELMKKLSSTQNLITLMTVLDETGADKNLFRYFIFNKIDEYSKKPEYEQAYYTYVISTFNYGDKEVPSDFATDFYRFLDSKSLYTFINTMEAYYAFGDEELLLQALTKVDERGAFYNRKLLVDGLLSSRVNFDTFNPQLVTNFYKYSSYLQVSLLDFFRFNNYDAADLCLRLLEEDKLDSEIRYAALRYFTKFTNRDARIYAINLLESEKKDSWIDEMLAIEILEKYDDDIVYNLIKKEIYSSNWYIRSKSADYLHKHGLSKDEVYNILKQKDKYANEILLYQYRNEDDVTKYIINTIQLLETQEQLAQTANTIVESAT